MIWMSIQEAAQIVNLPTRKVSLLVKNGSLHTKQDIRDLRKVLVNVVELQKLLLPTE